MASCLRPLALWVDRRTRGRGGHVLALVSTFIVYACFHGARKVPSVLKPVLAPKEEAWSEENPGWEPFNSNSVLLGTLDTIYLSFYTVGLLFCGKLAQRFGIRKLLTFGSVAAGLATAAMGLAHSLNIHSFWYFAFCSSLSGIFQAIGWPCVISVLGNWFSEHRRGLVFGIWQSNISLGNVLGNAVGAWGLTWSAGGFQGNNWPLAAALPAFLLVLAGLLMPFLLVPSPADWHALMAGRPMPDSLKWHWKQGQGQREGEAGSEEGDVSAETAERAQEREAAALTSAASTLEEGGGTVEDEAKLLDPSDGVGSASSTQEEPPSPVWSTLPSDTGPVHVHSEDYGDGDDDEEPRMTYAEACCVDGVWPFGLALLCSKLIAYSLLFWLPMYMSHVGYETADAAQVSSFFDVGGILGGVLVGFLKDRARLPATVISSFLLLSIPALVIFRSATAADASLLVTALLMVLLGTLVDAPMHLMAGAVSADLGSQALEKRRQRQQGQPPEEEAAPPRVSSGGGRKGHSHSGSLALITGIVDSLGSIGGALQGIAVGSLLKRLGWDGVFWFFVAASLAAAVCLLPVIVRELRGTRCNCAARHRGTYRAVESPTQPPDAAAAGAAGNVNV